MGAEGVQDKGVNAAIVALPGQTALLDELPGAFIHDAGQVVIAITDSAAFAGRVQARHSATTAMAGLDTNPFDPEAVASALQDVAVRAGPGALLVVDMVWGIESAAASANFEVWGALCSRLSDQRLRIVSVYDWQMLTGDQILAALRGHQHFLAEGVLHENPFWLPSAYLTSASLREQVSFLLGRVVPAWKAMVLEPASDGQAAMGTDPGWLPAADLRPMRGLGQRWKIRCFGRLRIYTSTSQQIDWQVAGARSRRSLPIC